MIFSPGPDAREQWSSLICNGRHERVDRELVQMSMDERTRVFADLGGAQEINPENPDFVTQCLWKLNVSIQKCPNHNKAAFLTAQRMCPHYTNNPGFRIMFLRADDFDIEKSTHRIVSHFEEKKVLFGEDKLARDITLADLSPTDLESLASGGLQFLPNPDQFGRYIVCSRQIHWKYRERANMRRAVWYLLMSRLESEDVQRRGIVGLGYSVGKFFASGSVDYEMHRQFLKTAGTVPIRVAAVYMCYSNARFENVADVVVHLFNSFLRVRFRAIRGTRQECNYQLMLMGIPYDDVPVSDDGEMLRGNHLQWIQNRRELERAHAEAILQMIQDPTKASQLLQLITK